MLHLPLNRASGKSQDTRDTIVSIATAVGKSAVAIIRISGSHTEEILMNHCRIQNASLQVPLPERKMRLCSFLDAEKKLLDTGLFVFYKGPSSYTGEDGAELFLHGNILLLRMMMDSIVKSGLAQPAEAGEFTKRAYLSGKLDLTQAEAVNRMICARSERELFASRRNLEGELSRMVAKFRSTLLLLKAQEEARIDFSTEGLDFQEPHEQKEKLDDLIQQLDSILNCARETEKICLGFQIALVGRPNVGKSSFFNQILGWDRSIVSNQSGTTRDYVSEEIQLEGVPVRVIDTAGLRETRDSIEEQGVMFTEKIIRQSHLILNMMDGISDEESNTISFFSSVKPNIPMIHLLNKWDLEQVRSVYPQIKQRFPDIFCVSCLTKEGLDKIRKQIQDTLFSESSAEEGLLLEERNRYHFMEAKKSLQKVSELWKEKAPDEIVAIEIDEALFHIGSVTNPVQTEEILGRVFSVFCVGK